MVVIAQHAERLERLGLSTLEGVRSFHGQLVKNHKGRRDIFRIETGAGAEPGPVLFLKRNLKPYKKNGLASWWRHGAVWSAARQEWENARRLQTAGVATPPLVAYGEQCGLFWERFSFLITEAAAGSQTVEQFLQACQERAERRRVLDALAGEVRRIHDAGLASPDLFTRHVFVDAAGHPPRFTWIDMARLDQRQPVSKRRRARDLAALNITAPLPLVSVRERLRFLEAYAGVVDRELVALIRRRMGRLLHHRRFQAFLGPKTPQQMST